MTTLDTTAAYNRAHAAKNLGADITLTGDEMLTLIGRIDLLQVELQEAREAVGTLTPDDRPEPDEYNTTLADAWGQGYAAGRDDTLEGVPGATSNPYS